MSMPCPVRAGRRSRRHSFDCRAARSITRSRMLASACCGVRPSAERTPRPDAAWSIRPATRTMKNSSCICEKIAQNLTRSRSGTAGSAARSSTRSLHVEPRELAVDQAGARIDLRLCAVGLRHHRHHHADAGTAQWLRGGEERADDDAESDLGAGVVWCRRQAVVRVAGTGVDGSGAPAAGRMSENVEPTPTVLCTSTVPAIASASSRTMARPSPVPTGRLAP